MGSPSSAAEDGSSLVPFRQPRAGAGVVRQRAQRRSRAELRQDHPHSDRRSPRAARGAHRSRDGRLRHAAELGSITSEIFRGGRRRAEAGVSQRRGPRLSTTRFRGRAPTASGRAPGYCFGEREFTVAPTDTSVSVDWEVALRRRTQFAGDENVVTANRDTVLPGGVVELRANWRNRDTPAENVVARIGLPTGTTLVPDSLILDGRPVDATPAAGYVEVPIGTLAGGAGGSLRYQLRTDADRPAA